MSDNSCDNSAYNVSVVIPAYNAADTIGRAIESVLAQTAAPAQTIVVDDGSTDNTAEIIKSYGDKITYIHQQNAGPSEARNTGIKAAAGNWIAFLDADDEWNTTYLQRQIDLLKNNPNLVWTAANYIQCLCDKKIEQPPVAPEKVTLLLDGKDHFDDFLRAFHSYCRGCTDTLLIRKDVLIEAGLFAADRHLGEDLEMWFKIAFKHPAIGFIAQPLATYHLGTSQSLTETDFTDTEYIDFAKPLIELAAQHNRLDAFKPIIAKMTSLRIRSLFFENSPERIDILTAELGDILSPSFKLLTKLLMVCPPLTATVCHTISKIVRKLKLRNPVIPPPNKPKK